MCVCVCVCVCVFCVCVCVRVVCVCVRAYVCVSCVYVCVCVCVVCVCALACACLDSSQHSVTSDTNVNVTLYLLSCDFQETKSCDAPCPNVWLSCITQQCHFIPHYKYMMGHGTQTHKGVTNVCCRLLILLVCAVYMNRMHADKGSCTIVLGVKDETCQRMVILYRHNPV